MARYEIFVEAQVDANGNISWGFRDDGPELDRNSRDDQVVWKLEATDQNGDPVGKEELCFARPSNANGAWGIDLKGVEKSWPGNDWLTDEEERDLNTRVRGQRPQPDPQSDQRPLTYEWSVDPFVIMAGVREVEGEMVHCHNWVRVVDADGNVSEIDPEVMFRSRF